MTCFKNLEKSEFHSSFYYHVNLKSNREASTGYGTPYPNSTPFRIRDSCLKLLVGEIPKPLVFKIKLERKKVKNGK
ncbi:hypothetical protein LMOh7858_1165 [Listeria monocytogenes str. 4b H7858]|nr:hypothetical protein LMOh7858_1165 [Listeria monocytogenes str. 4b H7858] [Listeria monocytogenes serotype 4b str. H7858]